MFRRDLSHVLALKTALLKERVLRYNYWKKWTHSMHLIDPKCFQQRRRTLKSEQDVWLKSCPRKAKKKIKHIVKPIRSSMRFESKIVQLSQCSRFNEPFFRFFSNSIIDNITISVSFPSIFLSCHNTATHEHRCRISSNLHFSFPAEDTVGCSISIIRPSDIIFI